MILYEYANDGKDYIISWCKRSDNDLGYKYYLDIYQSIVEYASLGEWKESIYGDDIEILKKYASENCKIEQNSWRDGVVNYALDGDIIYFVFRENRIGFFFTYGWNFVTGSDVEDGDYITDTLQDRREFAFQIKGADGETLKWREEKAYTIYQNREDNTIFKGIYGYM